MVACSDSTAASGPSSFPFPTADDRWDTEAGALGGVSGTRSPPSASRADVVLKLTEPAACDHSLFVAAGADGSWQVSAIPIVVATGDSEARFSADTKSFSGRAITLQISTRESTCGPLRVAMSDSTVTFVP
jgi:hypothetical protein